MSGLDDLIILIDQRAKPAKFELTGLPRLEITPPPGTTLWQSPYAQMALWPLASDDPSSIQLQVSNAEAWIDISLQALEKTLAVSGSALDGYLIFALTAPPAPDVEAAIRQIELSTFVCRKNVVWPTEDGTYKQLDRVAALSLPLQDTALAEVDWPVMDETEQELLARFRNEGGPNPVAHAVLGGIGR